MPRTRPCAIPRAGGPTIRRPRQVADTPHERAPSPGISRKTCICGSKNSSAGPHSTCEVRDPANPEERTLHAHHSGGNRSRCAFSHSTRCALRKRCGPSAGACLAELSFQGSRVRFALRPSDFGGASPAWRHGEFAWCDRFPPHRSHPNWHWPRRGHPDCRRRTAEGSRWPRRPARPCDLSPGRSHLPPTRRLKRKKALRFPAGR